jgi:hypothetical protein
MTTETEQKQQRAILEEARRRLRNVSAQLITAAQLPPADVAGIFLVQAIALMNMERDATACAAWLRDLATGIEALGIDALTSPKDLN